MNVSILFTTLFILWTTQYQEARGNCQGTCPIAIRCSTEENVAWATDNNRCFVFRNNCFLTSENCHRQNTCQEELRELPKTECQKLCSDICPAVVAPVCATYNERRQEFSNSCRLQAHICTTGETWTLFREGKCPQKSY